MSRLNLYLLKEIWVPLASWVGFLFLLLLAMSFLRGTDMLLGSGAQLVDLIRVVAYLTPHFLQQALPVAFLLGLMLGLGRLSEDGEVTALNALGVSPLRLVVLPLALGLALGAAGLLLAQSLDPWGMRKVSDLATDLLRRNLVGDIKSGVFYDEVPDYTLYAERVERGRWSHVLLHDERNAQVPLLVLAEEGQIEVGADDAVRLKLSRGSMHRSDRVLADDTTVAFARGSIGVGLGEATNPLKRPWEEFSLGDMSRAIDQADRAQDQALGRSLRMALHWRLGQLLMPLAFALFGTPLALGRRGAGRARGFLVTLGGYIGYYALGQSALALAHHGRIPFALGGQVANVVFAAVGLSLLWRLARRGVV